MKLGSVKWLLVAGVGLALTGVMMSTSSEWQVTSLRLDIIPNRIIALSRTELLVGGTDNIWDPTVAQAGLSQLKQNRLSRVAGGRGRIVDLNLSGPLGWALRQERVAEGDGSHAYALRTADGGTTWTELGAIDHEPTKSGVSSICGVSDSEAWVGGANLFKRTTDAGKSWQDVLTPWKHDEIETLTCLDSKVFSIGARELRWTTDGGRSWRRIALGVEQTFRLSGTALFVKVGHRLKLGELSTASGQIHWRDIDFPKNWFVDGSVQGRRMVLALSDIDHLEEGTFVYRSTDGGRHFEQLGKPFTGEVAVAPDGTVFGIDALGRIRKLQTR